MPDPLPDETAALATELSDAQLGTSRRAFDAGLYELAYHSLAAALHGAEAALDDDRLRVIQIEATKQQDEIDSLAPKHRLSRQTGQHRGHIGWFDALGVQAAAVISRQHAAAALDRSALERLHERERAQRED